MTSSLGYLDSALSSLPNGADAATRLRVAIRAHAHAVQNLSDYAVAVLGLSFPKEAAGDRARKLRRAYVGRWMQLVRDAQKDRVLADGHDPRLLRDLIFGALNAVSLAGGPASATAAALEGLLFLER